MRRLLISGRTQIGVVLRRIPFTLLLLGVIVAIAFWTDAPFESLAGKWVKRLGFSTNDLWALNLERLVTSAVATHGGPVFWRAIFAVAALVGAAEWRSGTLRAFVVFSSSHLLTLLALGLFVGLGLRSWHPPLADILIAARDVGPSAGYFGCLALVCRAWLPHFRTIAGTSILLGLALTVAWELQMASPRPIAVSAALAHLLAFPIGWFVSWALERCPLPPYVR